MSLCWKHSPGWAHLAATCPVCEIEKLRLQKATLESERDALLRERDALREVVKEAANLVAHEKGDAKERGKTAEGRTVTALIHALTALSTLKGGS